MVKKVLSFMLVVVICFIFCGGTMSFAANYKMYYSIDEATDITTSSAVISGSVIRGEQINDTYTIPGYVFSVRVFETQNPVNKQEVSVIGGTSGGNFEKRIENLKPDTEYTFLVIGHSISISPFTNCPSELTFKTLPQEAQEFLYGDVNGDGRINSTDFTLLKRYILEVVLEFPTENGLKAADVDGNGHIDSIDLTYMRRYILGIITDFPADQKWIPYVLNENQVSFALEQKTDGNYVANIKLALPTEGYRVTYSDRVNMAVHALPDPEGANIMYMGDTALIEEYTGFAEDIITTSELKYNLGRLYPGKYEFCFRSNDFGSTFLFEVKNDALWYIWQREGQDPFRLERNEDGSYFAIVNLAFPTSGYSVYYNDRVTMIVPAVPDPEGANVTFLGETAHIIRPSGAVLNAVHYKDVKYTLGKLEPGIYRFTFNSNSYSKDYLFEIPKEEDWIPYELNDKQIVFNIIKNEDGEYEGKIILRFPTAGYRVSYNRDVTSELTGVQHPDKTFMVFKNDSFKVEANTNPLMIVPMREEISFKLGNLIPAKYEFVFTSNGLSKTYPFEIYSR